MITDVQGQIETCPKCGCNLYHKEESGMRWGRPTYRLRCDHCQHTWPEGLTWDDLSDPLTVEWNRTPACPNCRSTDTRIASTPRFCQYRKHRCRTCGIYFKSYEHR